MRGRLALLALLALACWDKTPGRTVTLSLGPHGAVLTLPPGYALHGLPDATRAGDTLIIDLPKAGAIILPKAGATLAPPGGSTTAILGMQGGQDRATLVLAPGSATRVHRRGRRIEIDVTGGTMPAPAPRAAPIPPVSHIALPKAPPAPAAPAAVAPVSAKPVVPAPEDHAAPEPDGGAAVLALRLPGPGDSILLPFDATVGAASFAYGGLGHAVFDDGKAIDLSGLKDDPVFGGARITLSPGTTHLTMKMPPGALLALHRAPSGWALSVERGAAGREGAAVRLHEGVVSIAMAQAADSLVLADPQTGGKLLVGTVHDHGGGVLVPHDSPEFSLLPSWEGVVVRAVSDRLALNEIKGGFALRAADGPALVTEMADASQMALENAGTLTRRFDLQPLPVPALRRRLDSDMAAAAAAPKQGRYGPRLHAAQDMLSLGLDREAAAVLQAARSDDPSQSARPDADALLAMAHFLAGQNQAGDSAAIGQASLGGSDEITLWRALMAPTGADNAARAAVAAADWRLLTAYPAPLRRLLMPLAAALLLDGGQTKAAEDLLEGDDDPALRARLLWAQGKTAAALALLDRIAAGQDRKAAAQALRDATEWRLRAGKISPAAAAAVLAARLFVWRDPAFEIGTRLRIGELLAQARDFRGALTQLRQIAAAFPEANDRVHAAQQATIAALVQAGAALTPVDLVALVDENTDLLGQGTAASSLTPVLVDKLAALDLPERAEKLVTKLMDATADAVPKAALGARLAGFRLDDSDAAGALSALDQSEAADLPADLADRRTVLRARALAALGEIAPALSLLAAQDGDDALQLQAELLEKSKDWRGAKVVLQKLVHRRVPNSGALSAAQQDLVLRLASAASQDGDRAVLQDEAAKFGGNLTGVSATLFQTLTAQPVQGVADLARAGREAAASRALPQAIATYAAH
jgi:hypothetical protein